MIDFSQIDITVTHDNGMETVEANPEIELNLSFDAGIDVSADTSTGVSALRLHETGVICHPTERTDALTGLYTKTRLTSQQGLDKVSEAVPGPRSLVFLDGADMGPAQKFGLNPEQTDAILKQINACAAATFGDLKFEVLRLGGDEFGIVAQNTSDSGIQLEHALASFKSMLQDVRDAHFDAADARVQSAQRYAETRTFTRALSKEMEQALGINFTAHAAVQYLLSKPEYFETVSNELSRSMEDGLTAFGVKRAVVALAHERFANKVYQQDEITLVNFDGAVVNLGDKPLTPELVQVAISKGDQLIHHLKVAGDRSEMVQGDVPKIDHRTLRAEDLATIGVGQTIETRYEVALTRLKTMPNTPENAEVLARAERELVKVHCADPTCDQIYRKDLLMDLPVELFNELEVGQQYYLTDIDLPGFGATNNKAGYAKADEVFRTLVEEAQYHIEEVAFIRAGGGIIAVTKEQPTKETLAHLRKCFEQDNSSLYKELAGRHAEFEHGTREALRERYETGGRRFDDTNPLRPYLFPSFKTATATVMPGETMGDFIGDAQWQNIRFAHGEVETLSAQWEQANDPVEVPTIWK